MEGKRCSEKFSINSRILNCSPPYVSRHTITADKIRKSTNRRNLTFLKSSGCCHSTALSSSTIPSTTLKQQATTQTVLQSFLPVFLKNNKPMDKYRTQADGPRAGIYWQDCKCKNILDKHLIVKNQSDRKGGSKSFINSVSSLRCSSVSSTSSSIPNPMSPDSDFPGGQFRARRIEAWIEDTL